MEDLNPRPSARQADALPTELTALTREAAPGIEPGYKGFADPRLTSWLRRRGRLKL